MSDSWRGLGNYTLGVEKNFGFQDSAVYGLDTIASGLGRSSGTLNLTSQVVATIETSNFYLGMLGLGHRGINLTDFNNPLPSPLSSLKSRNLIPSLSWGYTAGAPYSKSA